MEIDMPAIEYKIIVSYDCPPIGIRALDWSAIDDLTYGGEEGDPIGHGSTALAAIEDLMAQLEEKNN
jgi:hypothetical protein